MKSAFSPGALQTRGVEVYGCYWLDKVMPRCSEEVMAIVPMQGSAACYENRLNQLVVAFH